MIWYALYIIRWTLNLKKYIYIYINLFIPIKNLNANILIIVNEHTLASNLINLF